MADSAVKDNIAQKPYLMYMHAGSGNHGCEAIVRSLCDISGKNITVLSHKAKEDSYYGLDRICKIIPTKHVEENFIPHAYFYAIKKLFGKGEPKMKYSYRGAGKLNDYACAISIGGDNYCYDNTIYDLRMANSMFVKEGLKTALIGCSVEPELLERKDILEDMKKYSLIIARESITYDALINVFGEDGDESLTQTVIRLLPDPAFTLETEVCKLPEKFEPNKTIGINVSPLILGYENSKKQGITLLNYEKLIENIISETDNMIALIPHVVWNGNDDREPLRELYEKYKSTQRVILVDDMPAKQLKYIISKCRLFIGARTHATIAAYSTCVPTLVVGYSVKSRGIAKDLFGTSEGFVIPVQELREENDLLKAYRLLEDNSLNQKLILEKVMPEYIEKAKGIFADFSHIIG